MMQSSFLHYFLVLCCAPLASLCGAHPQRGLFGTNPDPPALKEWLDATVPGLLEEHQVPGAAVAIVTPTDGIMAYGYGLSNLNPNRETSPDTPFASGSVAKLFVWTSIMQLVERDQISLDDPIEQYLDFEIKQRFDDDGDKPITIQNLMSHNAGWEDYPMIGSFVRKEDDIPELGEALAARIPRQDWAPGKESAYSNYGSALAGYIVERVTGIPYTDYATAEILVPLGMNHTSVHIPTRDDFKRTQAEGYVAKDDDEYEAFGDEFLVLAPAGHLEMSAHDAGLFMTAYLRDGSLEGGGRILEPDTVELMRTTLFRNVPSLPGNAYGFWESQRHHQWIVQHQGDVAAFAAHLALFPGQGVGYYMTTNGNNGMKVREDLWELFMDEFYPVPPPLANPDVTEEELDKYVGYYIMNRMSSTSMGKIVSLLQTMTVELVEEDTTLLIKGFGMEWRLVPQGDCRFADIDNEGDEFLFTTDSDDKVEAFYMSEYPMMVARPVSRIRAPAGQMGLMIVGVLLVISGLIVFPIQCYCDRGTTRTHEQQKAKEEKKIATDHPAKSSPEEHSEVEETSGIEQAPEEEEQPENPEALTTSNNIKEELSAPVAAIEPDGSPLLHWVGTNTGLFLVLFWILFPLAMMGGSPQFPPSPTLVAALVFGYLGTFGLFLFTPLVFVAWNRRWRSISARVHATLFLLGGWILVAMMIYWKLIFARI